MDHRTGVTTSWCVLGLALAAATLSSAATIHVPADQPTIQAGLDAAGAGDVVLVAPGLYLEHDVRLTSGVTLAGESGAAATIIDAEQSGHGLIAANDAIVRGFTVRNSGGRHNIGLYSMSCAIEVANCIFADHQSCAIGIFDGVGNVHDCDFTTSSPYGGSGINCENSSAVITGNRFFADNSSPGNPAIQAGFVGVAGRHTVRVEANLIRGGVVFFTHYPGTIECVGNLIDTVTGQVSVYGTVGITRIRGNTIINGDGIYLGDANVEIMNNIIAFAQTGITRDGAGDATLDCNDLWANQVDYEGIGPGPADFDADPLFCAPEAGDYRLMGASPCLPGQHPGGSNCGLIGGFGLGCDAIPVRHSTWGGIKALFR